MNMCMAIPGKVIKIEKDFATIKYIDNTIIKAKILESCKKGYYVIVQAKMVVQKVPKSDAEKAFKLLK